MGKFWKVVLWTGGIIWAALAVMATIPAGQAVSNLQSWAELFGLVALGNLMAAKGVDYLTQLGSVFILLMLALDLANTWKREKDRNKP